MPSKKPSSSPYTLEKNVPLPKDQPLFKRKYPWPDMEVGDSFVADEELRSSIRTSSYNYRNVHNPDFYISIKGINKGKIRIWRVA